MAIALSLDTKGSHSRDQRKIPKRSIVSSVVVCGNDVTRQAGVRPSLITRHGLWTFQHPTVVAIIPEATPLSVSLSLSLSLSLSFWSTDRCFDFFLATRQHQTQPRPAQKINCCSSVPFCSTLKPGTHWRQSRKDVRHSGDKNHPLSTKSTELATM